VKFPSETGTISIPTGSLPLEAHACYRALIPDAIIPDASRVAVSEGLGGRLLYAGELDRAGAAMMVAGNVAGCATLAVAADEAARKQAIRDGIGDFVVTSLDEALRILKNEIRKRNSVGVCVGADRLAMEQEMLERGVLPDLVFDAHPANSKRAIRFGEGVRKIEISEAKKTGTFLMWQVPQSPARWMPKLDAIALDCLAAEPWTQRWIRLSPRYLGRAGMAERAFTCEPKVALQILREFDSSVRKGRVTTEVVVSMIDERDKGKVFRLKSTAV
jgi:urocanate hydratase